MRVQRLDQENVTPSLVLLRIGLFTPSFFAGQRMIHSDTQAGGRAFRRREKRAKSAQVGGCNPACCPSGPTSRSFWFGVQLQLADWFGSPEPL
jgi:hypothetical protein